MMMRIFLTLLGVVILMSQPVRAADTIIAEFASDRVDVTSGFTGADVIVFGTSTVEDGEIALVLRGPANAVAVRKKEKALGIWVNRHSVSFLNVPRYYDYAVSANAQDIAATNVLASYGIGLDALHFELRDLNDTDIAAEFQEAMIRTRQTKGSFPLQARPVSRSGLGLFRASFHLPADVPLGQYTLEAFVFKDGKMRARQDRVLYVEQVGFSARVHHFAHEYSFSYAMLCLALAVGAGGVSALLSRRTA